MEIGDDILKLEISTLGMNKLKKLQFMKAVEKKHGRSWGNTMYELERAIDNHIILMEQESNGRRN